MNKGVTIGLGVLIGLQARSHWLICTLLMFGLLPRVGLANTYHVDLVVFTPKESSWLDEEIFPEVLPERWLWLDQSFPIAYSPQSDLATEPLLASQSDGFVSSNISQNAVLGHNSASRKNDMAGSDPLTGALHLYQDANLIEERLIDQEQRQLQRSGRYRVLFQASFIEEFKELSEAKPYWLASETEVLGQSEAFGWLQLYKGRFLHVKVQWLLTKAGIAVQPATESKQIPQESGDFVNHQEPSNADAESDKPPAPEYWVRRIPIEQHQKLRSNKLYYLDHPGLGVLIMITPTTNYDHSHYQL